MVGKKVRLGTGFNIGGDQAEADPLLDEAFFPSSQYGTIRDRDDPRCFLVGRTGSGKSAILKRLGDEYPEKVIRIVPEDLSMPYITNLDVVRNLTGLGVDLSSFWKALWRHVLIVEVIRHRYKIDSAETKATILQSLREAIKKNPGKREALKYLDEYEGKFWEETDYRVREITTSLTKKIEGSAGLEGNVGIGKALTRGQGSIEATETEKKELGVRYQRVVNETQLARLSKMMDVLNEDVLKSSQDFTYIVIDDLDKDWVDSALANELIMALFKTVHDLKRVKNLKVLVALRTNIFVHLDFGAASGGQEEKFRSLVLDLLWNRDQLTGLMNERIRVASERQEAVVVKVGDLLPHPNPKRGNALSYLLDRTLMRPRDFISFFRECLVNSEGKSQISWDAIKRAEIPYSANRLLALRDEWKINYPGIDQAMEVFRHAPGRMNVSEMEKRLDDCVMLLADEGFLGSDWLSPLSDRVLNGNADVEWSARYGPLVRKLYDIGFLGFTVEGRKIPTFSLEEPNALNFKAQMDRIDFFYVARTYHTALEVQTND